MSVNIIWSLTNGGSSLNEPVDHGDNTSGNTLSPTTIYIRHTGTNVLTSCAFFVRAYSGEYSGSATASDDFNEIIAWADDTDANDFGGFQINMDATTAFPSGSWPTVADKDGTTNLGMAFRTGYGAASDGSDAVTLKKQMYNAGSTDGELPVGTAPNVRFQARVVVPTNETVSGVRLFEQVLKFTYTS